MRKGADLETPVLLKRQKYTRSSRSQFLGPNLLEGQVSSVLSFPATLSSATRRQRTPKGMEKSGKRITLEKRKRKVEVGGVLGREPLRPTSAPGHAHKGTKLQKSCG